MEHDVVSQPEPEQDGIVDPLINSRSGVHGGAPCFAGTRITVATIIACRDGGWDDATILSQYPTLTAEHLAAAWAREADPAPPLPPSIEEAIDRHAGLQWQDELAASARRSLVRAIRAELAAVEQRATEETLADQAKGWAERQRHLDEIRRQHGAALVSAIRALTAPEPTGEPPRPARRQLDRLWREVRRGASDALFDFIEALSDDVSALNAAAVAYFGDGFRAPDGAVPAREVEQTPPIPFRCLTGADLRAVTDLGPAARQVVAELLHLRGQRDDLQERGTALLERAREAERALGAAHAQARVAVAIHVRRADGAVLLGRRKGGAGDGAWCHPGGRLEAGESVAECAARELREETGIEVDVGDFRGLGAWSYVWPAEQPAGFVLLWVAVEVPTETPAVLAEPDKFTAWSWCDRTHGWPEPLFQGSALFVARTDIDPWEPRSVCGRAGG